jgi:DNA-binding NarL/FixJ family response regulator
MNTDRPIRVALVEDDRATRDGLRMLLEGTPGFSCIAACRSAEEALGALPREGYDVLLLDIHLPGMSGTDAVSLFLERWPDAVVLMLTVFEEEAKIFVSLCRGASGYLLKKTPPARLLESIREAADGGSPMSPEIARKVIGSFRTMRRPIEGSETLTPHEIRLLQLFAEGYSYQAAAERLHVSINTVRNYIRTIYDKLHVHSKSEAVSRGLKAGLI